MGDAKLFGPFAGDTAASPGFAWVRVGSHRRRGLWVVRMLGRPILGRQVIVFQGSCSCRGRLRCIASESKLRCLAVGEKKRADLAVESKG